MNRKTALLVFVSIGCLFSCNKDFDASKIYRVRLSRITVLGFVKSEFSYDSNGRLIKYTNYIDQTLRSSESKRYYDNSGKLIKIENAFNVSSSMTREQMDSGYSEMSYIGDRLVETKNYRIARGNIIYASRAVPDYDSVGRTIAVTLYDAANNQAYVKNTYQYNSQNNIVSGDFYQYSTGIQGPNAHYVYEHDNYANPCKDIWVMPYGANANNITKQTVTNYTGVSGSFTTNIGITVFKKYGDHGYPTLVSENGVDYVYEYK